MLRTRRATRESQKWHYPYRATERVASRERRRGAGGAPRGGFAWYAQALEKQPAPVEREVAA
jgi:hypothetical protein